MGQDYSVGIATGYGLDGCGSSPGRGMTFFFTPQHPYRLTHPASSPMGTGSSFPGGKAVGE
jgi:hypothetical protein